MANKMIKIVVPGEVPVRIDSLVLEDGTVLYLDRIKKMVVPSKKNQKMPLVNKKTGKAYLKLSEQYARWRRDHKEFFEQQYRRLALGGIRLPVVRCKITIRFYFPDEHDRDLTNKEDTIIDELVTCKILADDSFKVVGYKNTSGFICKDRPRTEIWIYQIPPDDIDYEYDVTDYATYKEKVNKQRANNKKFLRTKKKMKENTVDS